MSFFGRVVLTAAVVAGVIHVFRRDLKRIVGVLQKPTATFLADVRRELESSPSSSSSATEDKLSSADVTANYIKAEAGAGAGTGTGAAGASGTGAAEVEVPPEKKKMTLSEAENKLQ